jgi:hypothetical protein
MREVNVGLGYDRCTREPSPYLKVAGPAAGHLGAVAFLLGGGEILPQLPLPGLPSALRGLRGKRSYHWLDEVIKQDSIGAGLDKLGWGEPGPGDPSVEPLDGLDEAGAVGVGGHGNFPRI